MPGNLIYDTNTLIGVVPNLKTAQSFLLDKFFPGQVLSETEFVSIDVDIGVRRMAPFVSPLVEGKLVEQRQYQTNQFKPAYIKDKRAPDLLKPVRRMIGERIGGEMTGAEREMANLEFEMTDQVDMLNRRLEWMAAQALMTGMVPVAGEGYAPQVVDFGRDPTLTVAKTGTATWTPANVAAGNASPTSDIEAWQHQILRQSGARATDIVFTTSPYLGFIADPLTKGATFYPTLATSGNVVNVGASINKGAVYKGRWGAYDLWVYNDWYVNDANVQMPMLPDGTVILSGPDMMGTRAFGQIIDPTFNYGPMPYAPKTWIKEDPAQRLIMMQSSPLVIPSRVNAALSANVCASVYN